MKADRDCRWAVLAGSPDPAAAGAWDCAFCWRLGRATIRICRLRLDRSDAPWFADPSPEGQERDRQLRVVPEVGTECCEPRPEGPGTAELGAAWLRRGCAARRSPGSPICRSIRITPANWPARLAVAGKIENETFQHAEERPVPGTQLRTRNPAPVGYFRCADAAGVPDRPAAGNGLPRHEANLRQVLYPNRNVGMSAQQFLCSSLPQLAGTVRPRPRDLHRVPRLRYVLTADPLSSCSMKKDRDVPRPHAALTVKRPAYRCPEPVPTHDDMPCKPSENVGFPYRNMKRPTSSPK